MGRSVNLVCVSTHNQVGVELSDEESADPPLAGVVYKLILDSGCGLYFPLPLSITLSADTLIVCAMTLSLFCMCYPKPL